MRFARRVDTLAESATMRVTRRAAELRAAGRDVISFSVGEPDFDSPPSAVAAARRALAEGFTRYTPAAGIGELRRALAARYAERHRTPWTPSDVLVTVGAKAGLFELMMVLLDEGDEMVLPIPAWVSFEAQARFAGARVVTVTTDWRDGYTIHAEPVIEALSERTRVVLLNTPCNPTGGIVPADDLRRIVEACADRGVVVISDETYDRVIYDGLIFPSAAALAREFPDTVVLVGSFSKTYAMTGWRVGFVLGPPALMAKVQDLQSHMTSNPTSFAMRGALAALEEAEDDVATMIAAFSARRDLVIERLRAMPGVRCRPPAGTFFVLPDVSACYRPGRRGSVALAEHLLEVAGVAVVPGIAFGSDDHLRISFASSIPDLERGLERMARALAD
ncbi:MAG: pyridoxal phosphate-dependent aminotransferase [Acidobacteria bacterium]|nr:MAG: pyridoxal phosphate-dependent aminotransferase [Acidobacteriota bacterium]